MLRGLFFLLIVLCSVPMVRGETRTWTSQKGGFTLHGDLIAFNDTTAILKRKGSGRLAAVDLAELSDQDREYVRKQASADDLKINNEDKQIWTSKDGLKIRAKVIAYGTKDLTLRKTRGVATINGKAFSTLDPLHQEIALRVLSELEGTQLSDESDLSQFIKQLDGQSKTYPLEGVQMQLQSGDQIAVPFFLFRDADLNVLKVGWDAWKQAQDSEAARARENLLLQSDASHYQQSLASDAQRQQMEVLKLNMLAAGTGLTSIWEVGLKPGPGVYGRPTSVMVTAANSQVATQMVLPRYPGYQLIGVRKVSPF